MFSVGNLVPTINGEVKYQPKDQACFFIRMIKLEAEKACMQQAIFKLVLWPESH